MVGEQPECIKNTRKHQNETASRNNREVGAVDANCKNITCILAISQLHSIRPKRARRGQSFVQQARQ